MISIKSVPAIELESHFNLLLEEFEGGAVCHSSVLAFSYPQYYLCGSPELPLLACISLSRSAEGIVCFVGVLEQSQRLLSSLSALTTDQLLKSVVEAEGAAWVDCSQPLRLKPVAIAKPWGREIWYTGIEERGQSLVESTSGAGETPLPWLLALAPLGFAGGLEKGLCLLKVLDPLPEEVYGDLYFEMHEKKQEVYVVTHVDSEAWPGGVGGIRFGFNQSLRAELGDDAFKANYRDSVAAYESVRREVDGCFDGYRHAEGFGLNEPVSAEVLKAWQAKLPQELQDREVRLRQAMEAFSAVKPLKLGDVVKVPCFTPHSLQHGVRTVEFQTPVYERKILSFAQKVLTQDGWDTDQALKKMSLEQPEIEGLPLLVDADGCRVERVVSFDGFEVVRVSLGCQVNFDLASIVGDSYYALIMPVAGDVSLSGASIPTDRALLIGRSLCGGDSLLVSGKANKSTFLLAVPR